MAQNGYDYDFYGKYVADFMDSGQTHSTPPAETAYLDLIWPNVEGVAILPVSNYTDATSYKTYTKEAYEALTKNKTDCCIYLNLMTPAQLKSKLTYTGIYKVTPTVNLKDKFFGTRSGAFSIPNHYPNIFNGTGTMVSRTNMTDLSFLDDYDDSYVVLQNSGYEGATIQQANPFNFYYRTQGDTENPRTPLAAQTYFNTSNIGNGGGYAPFRIYSSDDEEDIDHILAVPLFFHNQGFATTSSTYGQLPAGSYQIIARKPGTPSTNTYTCYTLNPYERWAVANGILESYQGMQIPDMYCALGYNIDGERYNTYTVFNFSIVPKKFLTDYLYDFGIKKIAYTVEDALNTPEEDLPDVPGDLFGLQTLDITVDEGEGMTAMVPEFDTETLVYSVYTTSRSININATITPKESPYTGYTLRMYKGNSLDANRKRIREQVNTPITDFLYTVENELNNNISIEAIGYLNQAPYQKIVNYDLVITYDPDFTPEKLQELAPGQDINPVINIGGSGDFTSGDISDQQTGATGTSGYNGTSYIINKAAFNTVKKEMWDDDYLTMIRNLFGSGQNAIINCLLFPFNIHNLNGITSSSVNSIYLGTHEVPLTSPAVSFVVTGTGNTSIEIGPLTGYKKVLGGFLDDNPLTQCFVNLPFIGLKEIDPNIVYDKKLKVRYLIDLTTGETTAQILSTVLKDKPEQYISMYEFNGQIGIPLAFTESNINQNRLAIGIETIKGTISGATAGGTGGALLGGAESLITSAITHPNSVHVEGSTGSGVDRLKSMDVFLLFVLPETAIPNNYNKTKGRPSSITVAPSSLKGYTVINDPIIKNTRATEQEKNELIALLKAGIRIQ